MDKLLFWGDMIFSIRDQR